MTEAPSLTGATLALLRGMVTCVGHYFRVTSRLIASQPAPVFGAAMSDRPPEDYRVRQRTNLIALLIVVVLVLASVVLLVSLHHGIRQESCFAAAHRNCAPIEEER
jgi:hypothetical protein